MATHIWGQAPKAEAARSAHTQAPLVVNDIHSGLNATRVGRIARPATVEELAAVVRQAADCRTPFSIGGGRHAMGGQQFATGRTLLDTTALDRVVEIDPDRGLVVVEAGIEWPALIDHLWWAFPEGSPGWSIIQKQTGADRLTVGGAVSANIHGRGLRLRPFIADVESLEIVDPSGRLVTCSRSENAALFGLVCGGYGLFGPIARVTLRLAVRHKLRRRVEIARVDDLPDLFESRIQEGCEYGDFQFATDPVSGEFLRVGVFSCYQPVSCDVLTPPDQRALSLADWRRLLRLAHTSKSQAFAEYARYYMSTDGQVYWSDRHQLAEYMDGYHQELDRDLGAASPGGEMITELYVPRPQLPSFMSAVRDDARRHDVNIIYGTIRLIEEDDESMLAWARERWACIVFNIHVEHTPDGVARAADDCRRLIDRALEYSGSYYLTYHRWARADQVLAAHPRMPAFLRAKAQLDPDELFQSDWHAHHVTLLEGAG